MSALPGLASAQVVYTYDIAPALGTGDNNCPAGVTTSINVPDNFTVGDVGLGLDITHAFRGEVRVYLDPPGASPEVEVLSNSQGGANDTSDNYRIMLSTNTDNSSARNDGDNDTATQTIRYRRLVAFNNNPATGISSQGNWVIRICDNANADTGVLNSARLVLREAGAAAPASCGTKFTYDWGANGNNAAFGGNNTRGINFTEVNNSGNPPGDGSASFITSTGQRGADTGFYSYVINASGDTELTMEWTLFNFSVPVHGLSFSTLDTDFATNDYEDYIRVEGYADTAMTIPVPKQMVLQNAQLAYAGDIAEADSGANDDTVVGNVTWTFTRPVQRVRVVYLQGDQPVTNSNNQFTGIGDFSYCALDFGDGPASYNVTHGGGGASHVMGDRLLYLGTPPDGETDGVASANADSDGADDTGSVTLGTEVVTPTTGRWECTWSGGTYQTAIGEYCVTVNVTNTSGSGANLVGWLDWNGNGVYDAGERSNAALGGFAGAPSGDTAWTTANIPNGTATTTRVLVWSGIGAGNNSFTLAQTFLRVRLSSDASFVAAGGPAPNGAAANGEVEDYQIPAATLPVTLASLRSRIVNGKLDVRFTTATETDNVGFTIEERSDAGQWSVLGEHMIASQRNNSAEPSAYATLATVPASRKFYIVDHDTRGTRKAHGPFEVGTAVGNDATAERFNWGPTAAAIAQIKAAQGATGAHAGKLWVDEAGFHRVTAQQLAAEGVDLTGVPVDQIAITFRGQGVPRRVHPATGTFGAGSYIDFAASKSFSIYTREFPYLVRGDGVGVVDIGRNHYAATAETPAWYWGESRFEPNNAYNYASPTQDPWYAAAILGQPGAPASYTADLDVSQLATGTEFTAELHADLLGVTDWPGTNADHHVQLRVNNDLLVDEVFDGTLPQTLHARLPLLGNGSISVSAVVPGDTGYNFDLNYLEAFRLRYPRLPVADGQRLVIDALQSSHSLFNPAAGDGSEDVRFMSGFDVPDEIAGFRVDGLADGAVVAYVGRGDDWALIEQATTASGGSVLLPSDTGSSYWVSNVSGLRTPRVEGLTDSPPIIAGQADYLIITPTLFANEVQSLVSLQQSRGLTTRVVDLQQIYDRYNHSVPEGVAIQRFLDAAVPAMGVEYVLLVGGDTYDYKNFLNQGSISLVPTQYTKVGGLITYAPIDALYADANRDGAPEFALGRLPVRSVAELQALTAKLTAVTGSVAERKLMLVAQQKETSGADYDVISDAFAEQLPDSWTESRAYVDDVGLAGARANLMSALNSNYNLLSFVGHSAPSQWSFDPILSTANVASATGSPVDLVVQWGCWNSYFVSPQANTLAHVFLNTPGHGAAGVIGVASLTELQSHEALGTALYPELSAGTRVGDALRLAKMQLATEGEKYLDILMSATLLGDPAQPVR